MMTEPGALTALIEKQELVVARSQALATGLSPHAIAHRLRIGGPWQRLLPGVYLTVSGTPEAEQREMAALLYGGSQAVITGLASLRYRGVTLPESDVIDVLIPVTAKRQGASFVAVHRTGRMPGTVTVREQRVYALPARAVADAARGMTDLRAVRAMVSSVVQDHCCSLAAIRAELQAGPRQGAGLLARVLDEADDGVRSAPEAELRELIGGAGLPMPLFNPKLYLPDGTFIACPDAWWPEAGVAIEIDSRQWHFREADWERTMDRHGQLGQHSIVTLHFTPHKLRGDPAFVVARITNAYKSGITRPPLDIRTVAVSG